MTVNRILIVEDEPLIAMMLEDFLEALERECVGVADSVADGIAAVERGGIDAAILDINLRGGEQSWDVARELARANIPFILSTGAGGDAIAPDYRDRPVLSKPYTMEAVEKALDGL